MQSMSGISEITEEARPRDADPPVRTAFEKAVDKAFSYHPYRQSEILVSGEWVIGPTFVVKGEYTCPLDREPHTLYREDPFLAMKARGVLAEAREAGQPAMVDKAGHKMEQVFIKDKHGALQPRTAKDCTCRAVRDETGTAVGELAFPLLSLAKKVKVDDWFYDECGFVAGWAKNELVAVFAMKRLGELCRP